MALGWAVAVTQPNSEAKAVANVGKLGYQIFYPKLIRRKYHQGRRVQVICPLFPGYFFAWIDGGKFTLLSAFGMAGLLMQGEQIAIVRDDVMKALKNRCNRNGIYISPPKPNFKMGQKVRVQTGVMAGCVGTFDGMLGQRESALFELLGARTRVLFKEGNLISA